MSSTRVLRTKGLWLAVAESCSGGLLGARITDEPGASAYFRGGVVAYANEVKQRVLGVSADVLRTHGAVSAECAQAMAGGVLKLLSADVGLAVTGNAGPGGGTLEKPVGLVYIAATGTGGKSHVQELHLAGSRTRIRTEAVEAALELLEEALVDLPRGERPDHAYPDDR
ncbi:MAG: nicotinamide-nucleotide amidohydrolase family protein [Candidatus Bipolaricaulota bacterium]